ncbi:hypothetical protein CEUSTIGMA_g7492.t1 [Chlamydomonas eustigma]|uniref:Photolyase/cryptochrome alpha/beta domain-containing protein n=1 Tax=Chlamydomonas eustigma TaxID=1157962 RepID=A0A250XAB0_9CHLO|nr:hypothetical protein CEUSTIGMA_g7492.t1 [Chlamydomonas eustigma]|eukprot:GAX80053.1 hypothetical protein CEUSTIGMA_g7492.t1 [Chlamydomonas eustigma]
MKMFYPLVTLPCISAQSGKLGRNCPCSKAEHHFKAYPNLKHASQWRRGASESSDNEMPSTSHNKPVSSFPPMTKQPTMIKPPERKTMSVSRPAPLSTSMPPSTEVPQVRPLGPLPGVTEDTSTLQSSLPLMNGNSSAGAGSSTDTLLPPTPSRQVRLLSPGQLFDIHKRWAEFWGPVSLQDRNRMLARGMRELTQSDPWALDMAKQDSRDFLMGIINASELRDRFVSIFSTAAGSMACEELYKQMVMLLPNAAKRQELLSLCPDPWLLLSKIPEPLEPPSSPPASSTTTTPQQPAASASDRRNLTGGSSVSRIPSVASAQTLVNRLSGDSQNEEVGAEENEEEEADEDDDEYEDEDEEDEEDELQYADEQEDDYAGEDDVKEFRGWQVLDRSRIQGIAQQMLQDGSYQDPSTLSKPSSAAPDPTSSKTSAPIVVAVGSSSSTSSGKRMEMLSVAAAHHNSLNNRPARKLAGKKGKTRMLGGGKGQAHTSSKNVIVWLRQDLRLHDNPALCEAVRNANLMDGEITFLYIHSPEEEGDDLATGSSWRPTGASRVWLQLALAALDRDLISKYGPGAGIVYKHGPYLEAIRQVAAAVGSWQVYFNRRYEPSMMRADRRVEQALANSGFTVRSFNALLIREPWDIRIDLSARGAGGKPAGHFGTLTPFSKACERLGPTPQPLSTPKQIPVASQHPSDSCNGLSLEQLELYTPALSQDGSKIDWGAPLREAWRVEEAEALLMLDTFLAQGLGRYEEERGFVDGRAVSKLSPYLHFGMLSPRLLNKKLEEAGSVKAGGAVSKIFNRRMVWRDLAYWQLYHWPDMPSQPIRTPYLDQEWGMPSEGDDDDDDISDTLRLEGASEEASSTSAEGKHHVSSDEISSRNATSGMTSKELLRAWQRGLTGYPVIDAAMRQLWKTGWLHQNSRMAVASFLVDVLNLPWMDGARWFHYTLVDADLAINSMMWQNAGKSGLDQWNFELSPTSSTQDPGGRLIIQWVPELSKLPVKYLHSPWKAPTEVLKAADVVLGETYPHRITSPELSITELKDHHLLTVQTARALHEDEWVDEQGYDVIIAPKGSTTQADGKKIRVFTRPDLRKGSHSNVKIIDMNNNVESLNESLLAAH